MTHRHVVFGFIAILLVASASGQKKNPKTDYKRWGIPDPTKMSGTIPAQWRVLWTGDPQTEATISWSTAQQSKTNTVHYDTAPRRGKTSAYKNKIAAAKNGKFTGAATFYHHARLKNLSPGTTCYFVLESDGKTSKEMHFKTAPKKDIPIKIVFGSDSRSGGGLINVIRMYLNHHQIAKLTDLDASVLCFAFGGDYVRDGTNFPQWNQWMSDQELITSPKGRILPYIPARGNHEAAGPLYEEIFDGAGEPGKNWYATQIGPRLGLLTLNSQVNGEGEQLKFISKTLAAMSKTNRWTAAQYHLALYPTAKYKGAPAFKMKWIAEFDKAGLAIAVESDGHVLKRTHLMRGNKKDPNGTLYVGDGGYGAPPRRPRPKDYHAFTKYEKAFYFIVEFHPDRLTYNCVSIDGKIVDTFTVKPKKALRK